MLSTSKSLFFIFIVMSLTGCMSNVQYYDSLSLDIVEASNYDEKLELPKKDTLEEVIGGLTGRKIEFQKAYVITDLAPTYISSTSNTINKHIARGNLLYLYEQKNGRFSLSADEDYPLWINAKHVCFTEKCWIKPKTNTSTGTTSKTILSDKVIEKKYSIPSAESSKSTTPVTLPQSSASTKNVSTSKSSGKGYINKDGKFIPSPSKSNTQPAGATAKCRDNTWSYSQNRRGTCSGHGGVARWL